MKAKSLIIALLCLISLSASAGLLPKAYKYTKGVNSQGRTYLATGDSILTNWSNDGDVIAGGVWVFGEKDYSPIMRFQINGFDDKLVVLDHTLQNSPEGKIKNQTVYVIMTNGESLHFNQSYIIDNVKDAFKGGEVAALYCEFNIAEVESSSKIMSSMSTYDKIAYVQHVLSDSEIARIKVKDIIVKPKDSSLLRNTFRYMFNELSDITGDKYIYNDEDLENAINSQGSSLEDRLVIPR